MRAAIYTRVSTERQVEEGFSLEAQQDILMDVLERKQLQLYKVYSDPGISGGSFKRPGVQALLKDMKERRFDTILIHKLDRLSRNLGDLYSFIDMINRLDVRLIIAAQGSEEIDTRSPMGKAFLFFSGIWAQIYLENLREETLKGLITKAKGGGIHMSHAPLGYDLDNELKLVIVEEEAELIRIVFRKYLEGIGVTKIAREMNQISSGKQGGKWDSKRVRTIISNPTYAGYNHFKPEHWPEDQRIIREGMHQAIISREDYTKAQQYVQRRTTGHMSKRSFEYAYSGIVRCSLCGANYMGNSSVQKGKVYKGYRCYNQYAHKSCDAKSISERELNRIVLEKIFMQDDGIQPKKVEKKEKRDMQKEVEISNKRRKNWMLALGDGKLSPDDYAMMIEEEENRMSEIYARIREDDAIYEPELTTEEIKLTMLQLKEHWSSIDADLQKQAIQSMFRKVVIHKEKDSWQVIDLLTV
ncbi:recombinase family protein [Paenibacillus alba]|uniref:Recombinase family protein n=1 Tax=Paenibacillus alba TaxID=1197127 RepID=A0ABU6GEH0_9BACL|nr:recombinase family protein [Paenibacillus alba]MEC0231163.1 recombinase family protein [Paenibacillus alba]